MKSDKCQQCGKRNAKVTFAYSTLNRTHGISERICRQCHIFRLEKEIKGLTLNLKEQKKLLRKE